MPLTTLAFFQEGLNSVMEQLPMQSVGMVVVFICLIGLAVILAITGSIGAKLAERAKAPKVVDPAKNLLPLRRRQVARVHLRRKRSLSSGQQ